MTFTVGTMLGFLELFHEIAGPAAERRQRMDVFRDVKHGLFRKAWWKDPPIRASIYLVSRTLTSKSFSASRADGVSGNWESAAADSS